ncbi:MAG: adenylate/guanylate cyclase domain-containing protein [Candidatus Riflebacteria bacterium]|nr:adenylate/guanylate cyclase domain-containing protein [Candidatus Riflebacteria bacterium]
MARGLFALLVFLGLPYVFLATDRRLETEAEDRLALERALEEGNRLANAAEVAAAPDIQLQKRLERFHRALADVRQAAGRFPTATEWREIHQRELGRDFPRHDIFLAAAPPASETATGAGHDGGLGLAAVSGADLIAYILADVEDREGRFAGTATALGKVLRYPIPEDQITVDSHGQIRWGTTVEGSRAFWWESWPEVSSSKKTIQEGLLYAVIDLRDVPAGFGVRQLCRHWREGRAHLLFRGADGKILTSPAGDGPGDPAPVQGLDRLWHRLKTAAARPVEPGNRTPGPERQEVGRAPGPPRMAARNARSAPRQGVPRPTRRTRSLDGFLVFERPLPEPGGTLFLALPFPARETGKGFPWLPVGMGLLAGAGFFLVGERSLFGRGPRLNVGWVLIGAFVLVVLLPMSILRGAFRQAAEELTMRKVQEAATALETDLWEPCALTRRGTVALRTVFLRLAGTPDLARRLDTAFETGEGQPLFESVVREIRAGMSLPDGYRLGTVFFLAGPGGFSRGFSWLESGQGGGIGELVKPFLILGRAIHDRLDRTGSPTPDGIDKSGLEFEMARDTFSSLVGPDWFLRALRNPGFLSVLQGHIGNLFFLYVPVTTPKGRLMILGCILDQTFLNDRGLSIAFTGGDNPRPGRALFAQHQAQHLLNSNPPGLATCPGLLDLVRRVRQDNLGRRETVREGRAWSLREVFPATWMPSTIIAGEAILVDPGGGLRVWFRWVFAAGVLLALGASLVSLAGFLGPLERILGAMRRLPREPDLTLPHDAARTDEFGTLARAFHQMKQALREREILGKYVSASVRRAAQDRDVRAAARRGELRHVTVLFSAVHVRADEGRGSSGGSAPPRDPTDTRSEVPPSRHGERRETPVSPDARGPATRSPTTEERIFAALARHLEAVSGTVAATGGEIDKVMGEKILAVFDHERLGGADAAGRAALAVVDAVRAGVGDLPVAMGINAGEAVAGILGAPSVRMDYTVIGDTVNLAARLAALADAEGKAGPPFGATTGGGDRVTVVVSGQFLASLASPPPAEKLATTQVKGKRQAVETFRLA